jgi:hypothetical protein
MQHSDLPFGSELSPSQISLPRVLEFVQVNEGDWKALENQIYMEYFTDHKTSEYNQRKLANNTKLSLKAYGIIDDDGNFTDFGKKLYQTRNNEPALYTEFARHILINLNGLSLVQCILDIQAAGQNVDLRKLRLWLEERGIHFPRGGKHPSIMRLWLEKAGVFESGWRVDEEKLRQLLEKSINEIETLSSLSVEQKAFLKTIANIDQPGPFPSNEIERLATLTYGIRFDEKNLPKQVLYPLEKAGYITLERGTQKKGRGAKPFLVTPTEKVNKEIITPLIIQLERQVGADMRPLLRKPIKDILGELEHEDKYVRGLALEALAFKLMRLIDLNYVATRLRGTSTGGAEVDLIFDTERLLYSRWQIQCKNTSRVSLDDVAKEVGLTHFLKSNAVAIVSTGQIGDEARRYANKIMQDSNLCVIMIDRRDINAVIENSTKIVDILNREARHAMTLKKLEL